MAHLSRVCFFVDGVIFGGSCAAISSAAIISSPPPLREIALPVCARGRWTVPFSITFSYLSTSSPPPLTQLPATVITYCFIAGSQLLTRTARCLPVSLSYTLDPLSAKNSAFSQLKIHIVTNSQVAKRARCENKNALKKSLYIFPHTLVKFNKRKENRHESRKQGVFVFNDLFNV